MLKKAKNSLQIVENSAEYVFKSQKKLDDLCHPVSMTFAWQKMSIVDPTHLLFLALVLIVNGAKYEGGGELKRGDKNQCQSANC